MEILRGSEQEQTFLTEVDDLLNLAHEVGHPSLIWKHHAPRITRLGISHRDMVQDFVEVAVESGVKSIVDRRVTTRSLIGIKMKPTTTVIVAKEVDWAKAVGDDENPRRRNFDKWILRTENGVVERTVQKPVNRERFAHNSYAYSRGELGYDEALVGAGRQLEEASQVLSSTANVIQELQNRMSRSNDGS